MFENYYLQNQAIKNYFRGQCRIGTFLYYHCSIKSIKPAGRRKKEKMYNSRFIKQKNVIKLIKEGAVVCITSTEPFKGVFFPQYELWKDMKMIGLIHSTTMNKLKNINLI